MQTHPHAASTNDPARETRGALVRKALWSELADVRNVVSTALETFRGRLPDHALDPYIDESRDLARQCPPDDVFVLKQQGRIVGTLVYRPPQPEDDPACPSVRTLMVHPQARGRGVGRALMVFALERARRDGAHELALHTAAFMTSAVRLYERLGFVRWPEHDVRASDLLGFDPARGDLDVIAYRCALR